MVPLIIAWIEGGVVHDIDDESTAALLMIDDEDLDGVDEEDVMVIRFDQPSEQRHAYVTLRDKENFLVMSAGKKEMGYKELKEAAHRIADEWQEDSKRLRSQHTETEEKT